MATTYKVLGQVAPVGGVATTLYTVPAGTQSVCSTLAVCSRGPVQVPWRLAVRPAGAVLASQHYIVYDTLADPGETVFLTIGLTLAATDVVTVIPGGTGSVLSLTLFGSEIT